MTTRWRIPAGKLMRIVLDAPRRRRDADFLEQVDRALARVRLVHRQMRANRFDQLPPHCIQRIEGRQRILEHRADLAPAHGAHRFVRQVVDAPAGKAGSRPQQCARADRSIR
jgi:hypothetical protein